MGLLILIVINPVTSNMVKYYEKTKSNYSKDTDHLVTINRNGVWIKEAKKKENLYIINADRLEKNNLINLSINIISNENTIKKIESEKANISQKYLEY